MTESTSDKSPAVVVEYEDLEIETASLTMQQAQELTKSIRDAAEVIWVLIARAHKGQAWKALGYDSWADYVKTEFDMSRSRSYQLLDQAKVIEAIKDAIPEGTEISVTESSARELKYVIAEAVPEIREKTAGLDPEEAVRVTQEILAKYEKARVEESGSSFTDDSETAGTTNAGVPDAFQEVLEDENSESVSIAGASSADILYTTETPEAESLDDPAPTAPAKMSPEDLAEIRKNVNAAHDIYSALAALASLPELLEKVIDIIPAEREAIINTNLPVAIANLEKFENLWNLKNIGTDSSPEAK